MRRSVQEAIKAVRATWKAHEQYGATHHPGPAWEVAKTLADEVERLNKRLKEAEAEEFATSMAAFAAQVEPAWRDEPKKRRKR